MALSQIPEALRTKKTYVVFSDTKLEMDPVIDDINAAIDSAQKFADDNNLNVDIRRVEPLNSETLFSLMIGKGYTPARRDFRYCTDRLKIRPQQRIIDEILGKHDGFIAVTGVRKAEGLERKQRLEEKTIDGMLKEHDLPNCFMLAPIEDWSSSEVWSYLYAQSQIWVDENSLGRMYSLAAGDDGDECRTLFEGLEEGSSPGCGKSARYGCWVCTLFEKDKTLQNLGKEYNYLRDKEDFRNWLVDFRDDNWLQRDVYNHKYQNQMTYNKENHRFGMVMPGGMSIEFREEMLTRLFELEKKIYADNGNNLLLTDLELNYIQSCWIEEGDFNFTVQKLAKQYGREVEVSDEDIMISYLATGLKSSVKQQYLDPSVAHDNKFLAYTNQNVDERYCAQTVISLMRSHPSDYKEVLIGLRGFSDKYSQKDAIKILLDSPAEKKQYHPSVEEIEAKKAEWKNDKISYWTFLDNLDNGFISGTPEKTLFGYGGVYADHFELMDELKSQGDVYDVALSETMTLNDQISYFEDCIRDSRAEVANSTRAFLGECDSASKVEIYKQLDQSAKDDQITSYVSSFDTDIDKMTKEERAAAVSKLGGVEQIQTLQ